MHYSAIDGLRAFLAWTVVAAHITWYTGAAERVHALGVINKLADNAVTIFIIISGFVITNLTLTRKELYLPYITRRALRLYPAYLVCLSFGICTTYLYFDAFANLPWGGLTPHVQETESQVASLSGHGFVNHLLAHLLLLNGVVPDNILYEAQMMFLAPAWSLSLEWQFYLVAPLVIAAMRNSGGRIAAAVVAGVAFIAYAKGAFGQFDHPSFLPGSAIYFAVGIITRLAFDRLPQVARYPTTLVILLLCVTFNVEHLRPLVLWGAFVAWSLLKIPSGETGRKHPRIRQASVREQRHQPARKMVVCHISRARTDHPADHFRRRQILQAGDLADVCLGGFSHPAPDAARVLPALPIRRDAGHRPRQKHMGGAATECPGGQGARDVGLNPGFAAYSTFPGLRIPLGSSDGLDAAHQVHLDVAFHAREVGALHHADAVLGRDRAAELDDDVLHGVRDVVPVRQERLPSPCPCGWAML